MLRRSFIIFASQLVGYALRLIVPFFLVRLMTVAEFGAYRQFFLLELYVALLFEFGSTQSLYYFVPRDERNAGSYFVNSLLLNVATFTASFTLIGLFRSPISHWLNIAILNDLFWYLVPYKSTLVILVSCDSYLIARQKIKASAIFSIAGQLLVSICCVAAAFYFRDLRHIILAMIFARAVQLVVMLSYIQFGMHGFRAETYLKGIWGQLRYGIVLGVAGTILTVQAKLHELFVSRYYGTEGYAVYSVGCTEIPVIQLFSQSVAVVALARFALLEKQNDWGGVRRLWKDILTSMYAVAIPSILLFLLASGPLIRIMFTKNYIGAVPIFRVNTLVKLQYIHNATLVLRAMNRNDVSIRVNLAVLILTPFALYGGMMVAGMTGVIAAQLLLVVGGRLILLAWLNRVSKADLDYLVSPKAVFTFYRESWGKLKQRLNRRFHLQSSPDYPAR